MACRLHTAQLQGELVTELCWSGDEESACTVPSKQCMLGQGVFHERVSVEF